MKQLTKRDLDDLASGATVLGSGGGGDTTYDLLMTKQSLEASEGIALAPLDSIEDEGLVLPVAVMGAPLVGVEKLLSGIEFKCLLGLAEEVLQEKISYVMAAEVGGGNALTPLMVGAQVGIPVIDADTLGRAFPELQMSSCNLKGISPQPAFLSDCMGNTACVKAKDAHTLERLCRKLTVEMGSISALGVYVMRGKEAKRAVIPGTLSRAISIGRTLRESIENGTDPFLALVKDTGGRILDEGMITDVQQSIEGGFLKGSFTISGNGGASLKILYQNEFLAVFADGKPIASTPDIIIPLELETATPITSESLAYGLRVALIEIPGPEIWKTREGLALVGPRYFGYPFSYEELSPSLR